MNPNLTNWTEEILFSKVNAFLNDWKLITLGIVILIIIFRIIAIFNSLIKLKNEVDNSWSQIDIQLKRRYDLVPNLIETVKGYIKHERETLESITKLRQQAISISDNVEEKAKIETELGQKLSSLLVVAEGYPELKSNVNFVELQEELASTENKIAFARQAYNDSVMTFNTRIQMFPDRGVASMLGYNKPLAYFEIPDIKEREPVKISF